MKKQKMTLLEAKTLSLEVWDYLHSHPEIDFKDKLPIEIYIKIKNCECECPLCETIKCPQLDRGTDTSCPLFPCAGAESESLEKYSDEFKSKVNLFDDWNLTMKDDFFERRNAALAIYKAINAWEVK